MLFHVDQVIQPLFSTNLPTTLSISNLSVSVIKYVFFQRRQLRPHLLITLDPPGLDPGTFPLEHELALDDSVLTNRMHPLLGLRPCHGRRRSLLLTCFLWKHIPWKFLATCKSTFPDATKGKRSHGDGKNKKHSKNPRCSCPLVFQSLAFFGSS